MFRKWFRALPGARLAAAGMNVELPYGDGTLTATLPADTRRLSSDAEVGLPPLTDLDAAVRAALERPLGLPRLRELAKSVAIASPSRSTTTRSARSVRSVPSPSGPSSTSWPQAGVTRAPGATGVRQRAAPHVPAGRARRGCSDDDLVQRVRRSARRATTPRTPTQIVDLGVTAEHGYPVEVSRLVTDSDLTIYVNTNYIRGFTGGWKSVCVGLSTWTSIRVTHDPDGMSMSLNRNRMHAVLDEMGHHLEQRLGPAHLQDRHAAEPIPSTSPGSSPAASTRRARPRSRSRPAAFRRAAAAAAEPCDVLVYGVPDSSPYAIWASVNPILTLISMGLGYLGGMIDAVGKPGVHGDHGDGRARVVGPRASPVVPRRLGARAAADARSLRDHVTLRDGVRAPRRAHRRLPPPLRVPPDPRHPRHASAQAPAPRRAA